MTSSGEKTTLAQAAASYLAELPPESRAREQGELNRFVRWYGGDRPVPQISPLEIANYAEAVAASGGDPGRRLEPVRSFLSFLKQQRLTQANLAVHLKWRKNTARPPAPTLRRPAHPVSLTPEGQARMEAELEVLKKERPQVVEDIRHAAADKDFRENAPLDAARERQGHLEARIRELEATLKAADMAKQAETGPASPAQTAGLGSRVVMRDTDSGEEMRYTLVTPSETDPLSGKVSAASPVGSALMGKAAGDEVEVVVPAGRLRYRIQAVEG